MNSIPTWRNETFLKIYISIVSVWCRDKTRLPLLSTQCLQIQREPDWFDILISSLWCQSKAWRLAPPLNTQCLQNSTESGKQSVSTLCSLCVSCCVRDIVWSCFFYIINYLQYVGSYNLQSVYYTKKGPHSINKENGIIVLRPYITKRYEKIFKKYSYPHQKRFGKTGKASLSPVTFVTFLLYLYIQ